MYSLVQSLYVILDRMVDILEQCPFALQYMLSWKLSCDFNIELECCTTHFRYLLSNKCLQNLVQNNFYSFTCGLDFTEDKTVKPV